jgi:hypothetical protein
MQAVYLWAYALLALPHTRPAYLQHREALVAVVQAVRGALNCGYFGVWAWNHKKGALLRQASIPTQGEVLRSARHAASDQVVSCDSLEGSPWRTRAPPLQAPDGPGDDDLLIRRCRWPADPGVPCRPVGPAASPMRLLADCRPRALQIFTKHRSTCPNPSVPLHCVHHPPAAARNGHEMATRQKTTWAAPSFTSSAPPHHHRPQRLGGPLPVPAGGILLHRRGRGADVLPAAHAAGAAGRAPVRAAAHVPGAHLPASPALLASDVIKQPAPSSVCTQAASSGDRGLLAKSFSFPRTPFPTCASQHLMYMQQGLRAAVAWAAANTAVSCLTYLAWELRWRARWAREQEQQRRGQQQRALEVEQLMAWGSPSALKRGGAGGSRPKLE